LVDVGEKKTGGEEAPKTICSTFMASVQQHIKLRISNMAHIIIK
jgi:hypothetical protein